MRKKESYSLGLALLFAVTAMAQDAVADNMLLYQRRVGGWPKHINEVKLDYNKTLTDAQKAAVQEESDRKDATIDNAATITEITYLVNSFHRSGNKTYLSAAENGIRYLLRMQHQSGGFPQFYPDSSSYRGQVTYNDNAMVNALAILRNVANGTNGFDAVDPSLREPSANAVARGIDCMLKTQIKIGGKLTGWCAQHDKKTLQPVKARAFELASLSGMETVGIVDFLMKVEKPSADVMAAVSGAIEWLQAVRLTGFRYEDVVDASKPKMKDRILVPNASAALWARFYDLDTQQPFFCGRDGVKKGDVAAIEHERRIGYAWYGTWPLKVLAKYPAWKKKHNSI